MNQYYLTFQRRCKNVLACAGRVFACVFVLAVLLWGAFMPQQAYGEPEQTITGLCSTVCINPGVTLDDSNLFDVTMPDGQVLRGHCIDRGLWCPDDAVYAFTGTWNGSSYDIMVHSQYGHSVTPPLAQRISRFTWLPTGSIELAKASTRSDISDANANYSLAGAEYGIYSDAQCTQQVSTLTTNEQGLAQSSGLVVGDYWVRECSPSPGFLLDETVYSVTVNMQITTHLDVQEIPSVGWVEISKRSGNTGISADNECYSLLGAQYGLYLDEACTQEYATLETNAQGYAKSDDLPIGRYWLKEKSPSLGFALDTQVYALAVSSQLTTAKELIEMPQHNPLEMVLAKIDKESGAGYPLGGATLKGAEFTVRHYDTYSCEGDIKRSWVLVTDEEGKVFLDNEHKVSGDDFYYDTQGTPTLPLGSYTIQETKAPLGYTINEKVFTQIIMPEGTNEILAVFQAPQVPDQVIRGDIEFVKTAESTQQRLKHVPFLVVSQTTGESHVLVTDANGWASSAKASHSHETNSNDKALTKLPDGSYKVDESKLDDKAGIWFGLSKDNTLTAPNDSLGALPYDANEGGYDIIELPVSENARFSLVQLEKICVSEHLRTVDLGTITNPEPNIHTLATGKDGSKYIPCSSKVSITDNVYYSGLIPGSLYAMVGTLVDAHSGEELLDEKGNPVRVQIEYNPSSSSGTVSLDFELSTEQLAGHDICVFEDLYRLNAGGTLPDIPEVSHRDTKDKAQTVYVQSPRIGTQVQSLNGENCLIADAQAELEDSISYSEFAKGSYRCVGLLMDKESGLPLCVSDSESLSKEIESFYRALSESMDNNTLSYDYFMSIINTSESLKASLIVSNHEFSVEENAGTTSARFSFDARGLSGAGLVVFEWVFDESGKVYAAHTDLNDSGQSCTIEHSTMSSELTNSQTFTHELSATSEASLTDVIHYENLIKGKEYTLQGYLVVKDDANSEQDTEASENYQIVSGSEASLSFTPETESGYVSNEFHFDASEMGGKTLVAFEDLHVDGGLICQEHNIDNEAQSVTFVKSVVPPEEEGGEQDKAGNVSAKTGSQIATILMLVIAAVSAFITLSIKRKQSAFRIGFIRSLQLRKQIKTSLLAK